LGEGFTQEYNKVQVALLDWKPYMEPYGDNLIYMRLDKSEWQYAIKFMNHVQVLR